jgi:integrase/recombinase XerD
MQLGRAVRWFFRSHEGTAAAQTAKWYERRLRPLAPLHKRQLKTITPEDLRGVWSSLVKRNERYTNSTRPVVEGGLSPATLDGYIRAWRAFWNWCIEQNYTAFNPARKLKRPPVPVEPRRGIDYNDMVRLVEVARGSPRDYALMMFLADTACRAGGVAGLTRSDLDLDRMRAVVREKGQGGEKKARTVFFKHATRDALRAWLQLRPSCKHDYVFTGIRRPHKRMTSSGVYFVIERHAECIGLNVGWNPHNWRHGGARAMIKRGANLAQVQQLLGHTDISVTSKFYGSFVDEELQLAHRRYSWVPEDGLSQTTPPTE